MTRGNVGDRLGDVILARTRETDRGCLEWTATRFVSGYGRLKSAGRDTVAHRLAYEAVFGTVASDLQLDHLCRNRACVNPFHLEPVTGQENQLRGDTFARANAAKTHCPKGHPLEPGNLVTRKERKRQCLECHRATTRATLARWRAKPGNLHIHAERQRAWKSRKQEREMGQ